MNFSTYWNHADAISQTLYFVLLAMSIATWTIFFLRYSNTKKLKVGIRERLVKSLDDIQHKLAPLAIIDRKIVAEQALLRQIGIEKANAERSISVLGTVASIAPFVGLFGTVWGIFHALVAVGQSGQAGLAQVATPVGEALIMTGLGLAVAIPAVLGYNICSRLNRRYNNEVQELAHDVLLDAILQQNPAKSTVTQAQTVGSQA